MVAATGLIAIGRSCLHGPFALHVVNMGNVRADIRLKLDKALGDSEERLEDHAQSL